MFFSIVFARNLKFFVNIVTKQRQKCLVIREIKIVQFDFYDIQWKSCSSFSIFIFNSKKSFFNHFIFLYLKILLNEIEFQRVIFVIRTINLSERIYIACHLIKNIVEQFFDYQSRVLSQSNCHNNVWHNLRVYFIKNKKRCCNVMKTLEFSTWKRL